nr:hypothetical protein [Tanacetum cinerariifolium]
MVRTLPEQILNRSHASLNISLGFCKKFVILFRRYMVLDGGKNWLINFETRSSQVRIDLGGSLSSHIRASPSNEKGNCKSLIVVLGTSGCLNVEVTLLKKRRWLCGSWGAS